MAIIEFVNTGLAVLLFPAFIYNLVSLYLTYEFFKRENGHAGPSCKPPVSILKPLKGKDPGLRENLESFCAQSYPEYEVVFGVSDQADEAVAVAKEVCAIHGPGRARIVISEKEIGENRKVSNLKGILEAARFDLVAINDSDMRVGPDYLREIAAEYHKEDDTGMVTSFYKTSDPASTGAALESLTIALDFIPSVLVARRLEGVTFGLGASMLLSKKTLEDIGGLDSIEDYLADDYQLGNRIWKNGGRIVLSRMVLENAAGRMTISGFLSHQLRWARTYKASRPWGFLGYGVTFMLPLAMLLFILSASVLTAAALCSALLLRFALAFVIYEKEIRTTRWLRWAALLPLKDSLSFGIWLWSFTSGKIVWRGRRYRILKGGKLEDISRIGSE